MNIPALSIEHRPFYYLEELQLGMKALLDKTVVERDINLFAEVSTDCNPVHLNSEYAKKSQFGGIIAHGMLTAGLISAILGNQLPGEGTIYIGQNLEFRRPVRLGDTVHVEVTVTEIDRKKARVTLSTIASVKDKVVLEGEAVVLPPRRN